MLLGWFDARQATEVGVTLADQFAAPLAPARPARDKKKKSPPPQPGDRLRELLKAAERAIRPLQLNFYKRAKLANSFKWRLLENGVESATAADVTQTLVMHLSLNQAAAVPTGGSFAAPADQLRAIKPRDLVVQAQACMAKGSYLEAIDAYRALIKLNPRDAATQNNLGAALCYLARVREAEPYLRSAISIKPNLPDAHINLASVLRAKGNMAASENSLRRALKLSPSNVEARSSLGATLLALARIEDAKVQFEKALKLMPQHADALLGMAQIANVQGRFDEAEALYRRVLELYPQSSGALVGLIGLRKMTSADAEWLKRAENLAATGVEEINLRFAIGKYCDDVADFERAFPNYQRANELMKANADGYDPAVHTRFVDNLIRVYTPAAIAQIGAGASSSTKPVFVVGMPRSGTSLIEQIIASHPAAAGAGELDFWSAAVVRHETAVRQGLLGESLRSELADSNLKALAHYSADALRVVDKTPVNADYLGLIHSVFPQARIIYAQRHPIDTCLSCYFQQFSAALSYTMDLSDLAHYYRQHHRLVAHWRAVLPPGMLLDVPYEELVADQEAWTRRILDFLGLEWDERCLNFHSTRRTVATASAWQVRQKIYKGSVQRWRHYEKFIGPLRALQELAV